MKQFIQSICALLGFSQNKQATKEATNNQAVPNNQVKTKAQESQVSEEELDIAPFYWVDNEESASVCLEAGEYLEELFLSREEEGFEGSGYDWEALAKMFIKKQMPKLSKQIDFDSEAGMFCAYSEDKQALKEFALQFKAVCEEKERIMALFMEVKPEDLEE